IASGAEDDLAIGPEWFNRVTDRILDQGLQNKIRDVRLQGRWLEVHLYLQAVAETNLLDLQVALDEFKFLVERHFLLIASFQRQPQKIAQTRNHFVGGVHVLKHEG